MKLAIIKKNKIKNYTLPKENTNSYWITDYDELNDKTNLIELVQKDNAWEIISNSEIKVILNNTYVSNIKLKEYEFFYLKPTITDTLIIIYCYPDFDNTFKQFSINNNTTITIGNSKTNNIYYNSPHILPNNSYLIYSNNQWTLKCGQGKFVYVNNKLVQNKILQIGDIIFIMGLKIIIAGNFIVVNNPNNLVTFDVNILLPKKFVRKSVDILNEEADFTLYSPTDYFHKSPRFISTIQESVFKIDPPPDPVKKDDKPFIYTLGPMMTMGLTSVMFAWQAINGVVNEGKDISTALPSIVMSIAMLLSTLFWPTLSKMYDNKNVKRKNKKIFKKYTDYINKFEKEIETEISNQKITLIQNNADLNDCVKIIMSRTSRLWERRLKDDDFLNVRIGLGNVDSKIKIETKQEGFTVEENNLKPLLDQLLNKSKLMENVPICVSFTDKNVVGIVGNNNLTVNFINGLILKLITFHSYEKLKIILLTNEDDSNNYNYLKILPHSFSNNRDIRFFGTNSDEIQQISNYLDDVLNKRISNFNEQEESSYKEVEPYYFIIVDSFKEAKNMRIIKRILETDINYGFSIVFKADNLSTLPNECTTFINLFEKESGLFENELIANKQKIFFADFLENINMFKIAQILANTPIEDITNNKKTIPESIGFLEMYNVGKIEQLNIQEKWKTNNPYLSLQAPIGIDENGEIFKLDIHEKYHGPHGLIAGMTGSGKSEFIITYLLSLAVEYHPNDVSFVLIDYKGGGLSGAFENKERNIKLPHIAGSITNLDKSDLDRALTSIQSELRRRQTIFNKTRDKLNESTMDIYKYQSLYRQGVITEPIPHLLIISDEFAELKSQQPDFMDQLISTARIGRSLGVHLILATQKPAGVVNDQIWSNSRFRVCLKVQEKSDSIDVIKRPDAAELKNVGRFYIQVGYNELFKLGQAAWCGMHYIPQDIYKKKEDTSINFIDNVGNVIKTIDNKKKSVNSNLGEELANIVKYLDEIAKQNNIETRKLWLDKIPAKIFVEDLKKKYSFNKEPLNINPIIGEYDDPYNQRQGLLTLPLTNNGNTLIYGAPGSGKEMLLNTIIYSTITMYSAKEVNIYILDFGGETLKIFSKAPHIGDVLLVTDEEKINNLFKQLYSLIENRKKLFREYNGEYKTYSKKSGNILPTILIIINSYETFIESYSQYAEDIQKISRDSYKYGIIFILSTNSSNSIRYSLQQNFNQTLALKISDSSDYTYIFGKQVRTILSKEKGRGLVSLDNIYEFQTASINNTIDDDNTFIEKLCKSLTELGKYFATKIPVLPKTVTFELLEKEISTLDKLPLGYLKENLEAAKYNFNKTLSIITGETVEFSNIISGIIKILNYLINYQLIVIDALNLLDFTKFQKGTFINDNFNQVFQNIYNHIENSQKPDRTQYKPIICVIIGMNTFINNISMENKTRIDKLFDNSNQSKNINFIIIDSISELKKLTYEGWFTKYINNKDFVWIGSGIANQYTFTLNKTVKENYEQMQDSFGYVVKNGNAFLTKFINDGSDKDE